MHGVGAGGNTNFMRHKDSFLGVKQGKICIFVAHRYSFFFEFAKQIELGKYLVLSKGERNNGGAERPSILSDAFEALIAAIYIDGGIDPASKHILNFVIPAIKNSKKKKLNDYKTALQEIIQKNPGEQLEYVLVGESGPDHNKHFVVEVHLNSNVIGKGGGRSKKEAEQQAAREALELMGY